MSQPACAQALDATVLLRHAFASFVATEAGIGIPVFAVEYALNDRASRTALRRIGARRYIGWLAVVAMLLLVAMPVVSRVLAQTDLVAGLDCMHASGKSPGSPQAPVDPGESCGYCVLLHDSPFVGTPAVVLLPLPVPSTPLLLGVTQRAAPFAPAAGARPRGPPAAV